MHEPINLLFAASAQLSGAARRWLVPVLESWPASDHQPHSQVQSLEELNNRIESAGRGCGVMDSPILVVLGPDERSAMVERLADRMREGLVPAVVLVQSPDAWRTVLHGDGLVLCDWNVEPARLSAMLLALSRRQATVRALASALDIAQRGHAGMRSQVERVHEELLIASLVQREFLPRDMPGVPGAEVSVLFRPVGYVSGDIYDVLDLGEGRVGLFLADAVGHGVPAAMLTMALSRALVTRARDETGAWCELAPAEVLSRLNADVCRQREGSHRFATAVYAIVDSATRTITMAGAGHPAPLCLGRGAVRSVETEGPILGVFPEAEFTEKTVQLAPGESFIIFSDGLEAAFSELGAGRRVPAMERPHIEHLTRLGEWVARGEGPVRDMLSSLGMLLDGQSGSLHQPDDVTALAINFPCARALEHASPRQAA